MSSQLRLANAFEQQDVYKLYTSLQKYAYGSIVKCRKA